MIYQKKIQWYPLKTLSYLEVEFDFDCNAGFRYADAQYIRSVNLGSFVFFTEYEITAVSGKDSETVAIIQIICLLYRILTSSKGSDDLCIGSDHDRNQGRNNFRDDKNDENTGNFFIRFFQKIFPYLLNIKKCYLWLGLYINVEKE